MGSLALHWGNFLSIGERKHKNACFIQTSTKNNYFVHTNWLLIAMTTNVVILLAKNLTLELMLH